MLLYALVTLLLPPAHAHDETTPVGPGEPVQGVTNFRLTDHRGLSHELHGHYDATAVVLIVDKNLSPEVEAQAPEIKALEAEFAHRGVLFWIINAEEQVDRPGLLARSEALGLTLPILHDWAGYVVEELAAERVSEVVALNPLDWTPFYQGAMVTAAGERPLAAALAHFLRGEEVAHDAPPADGPLIHALDPADSHDPHDRHFSYAEDIAPLLINKCIACHSHGNIAPFEMTDYQAVLDWAPFFKEEIMAQRMPPWYADPEYGDFANVGSLTREETAMFIHWLNDGAQKDPNEEDPIVTHLANQPPVQGYPFAWPPELGQPDVILSIPKQVIPPAGLIDYRYLPVSSGLKEDRWLKAAVVLPGNPRVVHHCLTFVGSPAGDAFGLSGNFTGYVPGTQALAYPEGTGKFLPRGALITFQMHYITTGQMEEDASQLGLYFLDGPPEVELTTGAASTFLFAIPPRDPDVELTATKTFDQDAWLYELSPHMHYRGSRFRYEARYPDGSREILASVPKYWFDWQVPLRFSEPVFLPRGTRLECIGAFDNSVANRDNPNPNQWVFFGDQTEEEMFIGYMNFGVEIEASSTRGRR